MFQAYASVESQKTNSAENEVRNISQDLRSWGQFVNMDCMFWHEKDDTWSGSERCKVHARSSHDWFLALQYMIQQRVYKVSEWRYTDCSLKSVR